MSKKQKLSSTAQGTAAAVTKLLDDVAADELPDTLAAVEASLEAAKSRLKALGRDPKLEQLVSAAMSWVNEAPTGKENKKGNTEDSVRQLLTHLQIKKTKSSFDEASSDISRNTMGADFDIQFTVGDNEGFVSGSAANTEGVDFEGQLETSFLPILEENLLQHVEWAPRWRDCRVKDDVVQWMMTADIPETYLDWRDACRAVAAAVFLSAKQSKYNDEPWVFEFLEKRVREELLLCPDRPF